MFGMQRHRTAGGQRGFDGRQFAKEDGCINGWERGHEPSFFDRKGKTFLFRFWRENEFLSFF
jgi:hypothetical protein